MFVISLAIFMNRCIGHRNLQEVTIFVKFKRNFKIEFAPYFTTSIRRYFSKFNLFKLPRNSFDKYKVHQQSAITKFVLLLRFLLILPKKLKSFNGNNGNNGKKG